MQTRQEGIYYLDVMVVERGTRGTNAQLQRVKANGDKWLLHQVTFVFLLGHLNLDVRL